MFSKILIANRGEIACRIVRTARRMGIATVAVYSEVDAGALHVAMADEARLIGPPPPRHSYLDGERILAAARDSGAEAVHPGYGFLSENADFAEACAAAGLVFIGPPPAAIRTMGSKAAAKALMERHGVPVVPGYHGADQDDGRLLAEAERIGFPVILKASAGGGGRGMRVVTGPGEFVRALDGARREAKGAFGDDTMLVELYLERPRHIEVQVFGDTHGNIVHLFDRDCSIQRRHQKIVEEAPAPGLDPAPREFIGEAAVAAATAVGYIGAGTVEFIVEGEAFYFMEMNTRLQVEHPVTEAVTGIDLVEWQLRVAAGEKLPRGQREIALDGHAIEVRLYAENPARGFLPATGTLDGLALPGGPGVRVESGVRPGDRVTPFYDPMIAKIIAWGEDRDAACTRLGRALADSAVVGVATNLGFLSRIVADPEFMAGPVDTGFVARRRAALLPPPGKPPDIALAAVALHRLLARAEGTISDADGADRFSPWARVDGWRLNLAAAPRCFLFGCGSEEYAVSASPVGGDWQLRVGERPYAASAERTPDSRLAVTLDGNRRTVRVIDSGGELVVFADGESWHLEEVDPLSPPAGADVTAGHLTAPMPGRVVQLLVAAGDSVRLGQSLIVVEAMKMEHTIAAPRDGVVALVHYAPGDLVDEGAELIVLVPLAEAGVGPSPATGAG
ncbi:MAG TPA: acetyl/propionyl/methylcrotonyl-CoA carboxylase subunit alpha [Stellaceae bacterium]|nr:acetyl/propionyl/methylcrotonyl-CoA carboxylase subunit alpha [Stellaceae bacterium]